MTVGASADTDNTLTWGMAGWAAVMTIVVGMIVAAFIIRKRRQGHNGSDVESSNTAGEHSGSFSPVNPPAPESDVAQIHSLTTNDH